MTPRQGPLKPGTILTQETPLTPAERAQLQQAGITLPRARDLPQKQPALPAEPLPQYPPGVSLKEKSPTPILDINELPPERRAAVLRTMEELRGQLAANEQAQAPRSGEYRDIQLPEPPQPRPAPDHPESPPATAPELAAVATGKTYCAHCGWDQANGDAAVDDGDKLAFLQAFLGEQRFQKAYPLLGDRMHVVFRTLTSEEADLCFTQIAFDAEAGVVLDANQYFRTLNDYRLCLGLSVLDTGAKKYRLPEDLRDYPGVEPKALILKKTTALKAVVAYVYENILTQESIRRACGAAFYRFQRVVESLESHVDDPNFWPAIDGQP